MRVRAVAARIQGTAFRCSMHVPSWLWLWFPVTTAPCMAEMEDFSDLLAATLVLSSVRYSVSRE